MSIQTGGLVAGRYEIEERIAEGGMGLVFRAQDRRLERPVALKLLRESLADDRRFVERFRREARAVAGLTHPNIATIFDYGEDDDRHFIAMEFAPGRDLRRILTEEGRLDHGRATGIAAQVSEALGHAHARGFVHRDVAPSNVIAGPGDSVKVTDFGIARAAADASLTTTGSMLGTPRYMSPEQVSDGEIGPPSDVYSLGIVLYEMLTGAPPFEADTPIALALRHAREDVPPPSAATEDIPEELDRVVAKATARDPRERFADGSAMREALADVPGGGLPPTAAIGTTPIFGPQDPPTDVDGDADRTASLEAVGAAGAAAGMGAAAAGAGDEDAAATETAPVPSGQTGPAPSRRRSVAIAVVALLALLAIGAGVMATNLFTADPAGEPGGRTRAPAGGGVSGGTEGGSAGTTGEVGGDEGAEDATQTEQAPSNSGPGSSSSGSGSSGSGSSGSDSSGSGSSDASTDTSGTSDSGTLPVDEPAPQDSPAPQESPAPEPSPGA